MEIIRIFISILMMSLQSMGSMPEHDMAEETECHSDTVVYPAPLRSGDKIAILAPAGHVDRKYVEGAKKTLEKIGYDPVVYPSCYMHNGQFSGTPAQRFADLKDALLNPEIRAVLCARGGYGMVHILDSLATLPLLDDPKWVIGFSDISALHSLLASKGVASVHASMARHVALGENREENRILFEILKDSFPTYTFKPDRRNHPGEAEGQLLGGNLSVIQALINTPYDIIKPGTILFIEDVAEQVYKVERIMYQLKLSGILDNLKGLILGRFTEYRRDDRQRSMEQMMAEILKDYPDLPVVFNAPIGHVTDNVPLVVSSRAQLKVTPTEVTLKLSK